MNKLLKNIKYLLRQSPSSMKLKQKVFSDIKEIDRELRLLDYILPNEKAKKQFFKMMDEGFEINSKNSIVDFVDKVTKLE